MPPWCDSELVGRGEAGATGPRGGPGTQRDSGQGQEGRRRHAAHKVFQGEGARSASGLAGGTLLLQALRWPRHPPGVPQSQAHPSLLSFHRGILPSRRGILSCPQGHFPMRIVRDSACRGPDTDSFLALLRRLADGAPAPASGAGLLDWEQDIAIARAPGRLDVMGGIADYSGSLVLQVRPHL